MQTMTATPPSRRRLHNHGRVAQPGIPLLARAASSGKRVRRRVWRVRTESSCKQGLCKGGQESTSRRVLAMVMLSGAMAIRKADAAPVQESGELGGTWSATRMKMDALDDALAKMHGREGALPMARYPDPMLRQVASPVPASAFQSPEKLEMLAQALQVTAEAEGAVGLAASQVGVDARMIFLDQRSLGQDAPRVLVNPRITERSSESDMRWWRERCLVLPPDVLVTLLRDATISVEYCDVQGQLHTQVMLGEAARALQHELDHLNGVLILDHATDDEDLDSKIFPALKRLEARDHTSRQMVAFERTVS